MAIRKRSGRKKAYLVYWRNPHTQKLESKSVETLAEAEKLDAYVQYQLKYERDSFLPVEPETDQPVTHTLESLFYLYLKDRNFAKENLERTLKGVEAILRKYGSEDIEGIDTRLLSEMQGMCLDAGNVGTTVRRKMAIIKAMLNWGHKNGLLASVPSFPTCPTSETKRYVPPTPEEIERLYQVSPEHLKRVIVLGSMCGMRVGPCEMLKLQWRDVDLVEAVIRVPNAKKGYGEPWREVPIQESLKPLLQNWHDRDKSLGVEFVVHYKGNPVKKIRHSWLNALKRAGIDRHIRPYDLRHAFATEALANGANYGTVAALMGHKSPVMVLRHYQHVKNAEKKAVIEKLPVPDFRIGCMTTLV